jgi:exoribonuclease R
LIPPNPIFTSPRRHRHAFHGDLVLARLKGTAWPDQRDSRLRGEVVKVLQRKRRQLVGTLRKTPMFYLRHSPMRRVSRLRHRAFLRRKARPAQLGKKSWSS